MGLSAASGLLPPLQLAQCGGPITAGLLHQRSRWPAHGIFDGRSPSRRCPLAGGCLTLMGLRCAACAPFCALNGSSPRGKKQQYGSRRASRFPLCSVKNCPCGSLFTLLLKLGPGVFIVSFTNLSSSYDLSGFPTR